MHRRRRALLTAAVALALVPGSGMAQERFARAHAGRVNGQAGPAETQPYPVAARDIGTPVDPGLAYAMVVNLAGIYVAQGKYYQAELLYQGWLARLERALDEATARDLAAGYWLLALKDGTIRAVTDYWVEANTFHYVARDGTKAAAPFSEVDVPFTRQLNRERGMDFRLPKLQPGPNR